MAIPPSAENRRNCANGAVTKAVETVESAERDSKIVRLRSLGHTRAQVAEELGISVHTVDSVWRRHRDTVEETLAEGLKALRAAHCVRLREYARPAQIALGRCFQAVEEPDFDPSTNAGHRVIQNLARTTAELRKIEELRARITGAMSPIEHEHKHSLAQLERDIEGLVDSGQLTPEEAQAVHEEALKIANGVAP